MKFCKMFQFSNEFKSFHVGELLMVIVWINIESPFKGIPANKIFSSKFFLRVVVDILLSMSLNVILWRMTVSVWNNFKLRHAWSRVATFLKQDIWSRLRWSQSSTDWVDICKFRERWCFSIWCLHLPTTMEPHEMYDDLFRLSRQRIYLDHVSSISDMSQIDLARSHTE